MKTASIMIGIALLFTTAIAFADTVSQADPQGPPQNNDREQSRIHVEPDSLELLMDQMREHDFSEGEIDQISALIKEMDAQSLRPSSVVNKIHEGIAKGVAPEGIIQAAHRVQERQQFAMHQARRLTSEEPQVVEFRDLIASANSAGLPREECLNIVSQLQNRMRAMEHVEAHHLAMETMITARNLARQGVGAENTSELLKNALHQSYQAGDMGQMRHSFEQRARFYSPNDVAKQFTTQIRSGVHAQNLEMHQNRNRHGAESEANITSGARAGGSAGGPASTGNSQSGMGNSSRGSSDSRGSTDSGSSGSGNTGSGSGGGKGNGNAGGSGHGSGQSGASGGMGGGRHGGK